MKASNTETMFNPFALLLTLCMLPGLALAFENRYSDYDPTQADSPPGVYGQAFEYRLDVQPLMGWTQLENVTFSLRQAGSQTPDVNGLSSDNSSFEYSFGFLAPAARNLVGQARNVFDYLTTFSGLSAVQKRLSSAEEASKQPGPLEMLWSQKPEESSLPSARFSFKEIEPVHSFEKDLVYQMDLSWTW
ncbi:hypothetical protein [Endozoicomonas numazuensis]|uniref:Uncharacterized protein n=1 Tax=Endozoicomonas numazuensis TaxID=1137799 RepID=A0A081NCP0_9GAMM|nr:hypothetical protein [Endozoicomonas numazuensis]KEQ16213.1 hypothetical protein GZ78_23570 [Endozoicomonas numazuensis]